MSFFNFFKQLKKEQQRQEKKAETIFRRLAISTYAKIVKATPQDTGRARGNWQLTTGSPGTGTKEISSRQQAAAEVKKQIDSVKIKLGDDVWYANNVKYINELNAGSSEQAGPNFVDNIVADARQELKKSGETL